MNAFSASNWRPAMNNWKKYSPPFRPSTHDIQKYFHFITSILKANKKNKILLLGSTPEIREISSKLKKRIILVDFSYEMITGMLNIGYKISTDNEVWIKMDWLEMDKILKKNNFDLILGDLVFRNINPEEQKNFLKIIHKLLKKEGYFITRIHEFEANIVHKKTSELLEDIFKKYKNSPFIEDIIASKIFDKCANQTLNKVDKELFEKEIKNCINNKLFNLKQTNILNNVLKKWSGKRTWTQNTKEQIKNLFGDFFKIKNIYCSIDYSCAKFYPIYIFKKAR